MNTLGDAWEPESVTPADASWYPPTLGDAPELEDVRFWWSKGRRRWFLRWETKDGRRDGFATTLTEAP